MIRRNLVTHWLVILISLSSGSLSATEIVDAAKLDALARPLVDGGWAYGLAIGLITEQGTQVTGYGRTSEKQPAPPAADTIFEIASITKVFTGLLLAEMVEDHTVQLSEPVQKLLGDSMTLPKRDGHEIALVDLATHTSGLPNMPWDFKSADLADPYMNLTVEQLATFLSRYKLKRKIGMQYQYSNLGLGLLGHALAVRARIPYESLLRKRICEPLGMDDTVITLSEEQTNRLAQEHDADGNAVANLVWPALPGAGAIRSTPADLLKFLAANLGHLKTPLDAAIAASHTVRFEASDGRDRLALAWHVRKEGREGQGMEQVLWHTGKTRGGRSFAALFPDRRVGVIILCNTDALAVELLCSRVVTLLLFGQAAPLNLPKVVKLAPNVLESLVGTYEPTTIASTSDAIEQPYSTKVTREDDHLVVQVTGQWTCKYYPVSETRYLCRASKTTLTFKKGADGSINRLLFYENGQTWQAFRKN
jgi:serine-type D-Ala-D-Ala carboxypeptidase/endopeptidase